MSQVQDVKNSTDIVQILGERIQLQRAGSNWRALCPFHSEKSPSFNVNEQLQRYKCFGCGESGDVYTFLEKYEGMTFAEALQYLADRAGITLVKTTFSSEDDQRARMLEVLNLAKEYYHYILTKHKAGEAARAYLKERGCTAESIKVFQLGFALPSWDELIKYLHGKKKYDLADIEAAGLIITNTTGRTYDRFRYRIMFPLTDHRGRVVGFSGRVLTKDTKEAKYINTPETMLYHKGQMLFGYSQLYQSLRQANEAIIVEGEFDVISSAQAHVNNVLAVKGSALTEQHMKLLSRTVAKIILSFDTDSAGIAATKRAIQVAAPFGLEVRVIDFSQLPSTESPKDPDELARTQPQLWRQLVKSTVSVYEFLIQATVKSYDAKTPEGKRHIIDDLAPVFGEISHAVEYEYYVDTLAEILGVTKNIIKSDLQKFKTLKKRGFTPKQVETVVQSTTLNRKERLENYAVFLLFQSPPTEVRVRAEKLKHITFARPGRKQLVAAALSFPEPFVLAKFSQQLPDDLQQQLLDILYQKEYLDFLPTLDIEKEWRKSIQELIDLDIREEITRISQELDTDLDDERQQELLHKIVKLKGRIQQKAS